MNPNILNIVNIVEKEGIYVPIVPLDRPMIIDLKNRGYQVTPMRVTL